MCCNRLTIVYPTDEVKDANRIRPTAPVVVIENWSSLSSGSIKSCSSVCSREAISSSWPVRAMSSTPPKQMNMQIISNAVSRSPLNFHPRKALMKMDVAKTAVNTEILTCGKTNVIEAKVTSVTSAIIAAANLSFYGIWIGIFFTLKMMNGIVKFMHILNRQISIGAMCYVFTIYFIIAL